MKVSDVLVKVYEPGRLQLAWQQVRKNAGAAGIDQMTVEEFAQREESLLALIHDKLKSGNYRFQPAKRVLIPKPGTSKQRKLGIPVVMDRIVGTSMHYVLEECFDPGFTESNFGFRWGRSQHQAIRHLQGLVKEGKEWAVAVDLKSFFDEIPHGLILRLIRRKVADEWFVTLLARLLKAGVIVNGELEETNKGCPQGSPLSPMLSNIVLNELDHKLEERNLGYCRWADDFVIVVRSERAAQRVMKGTVAYLEEVLGLPVNREKSRVAPIKEITFLGFQILMGKIRVSNQAQTRFKYRVRELTHRNNPLSMYQVIQELNKYLRGWVGYFGVHEFKYLFRDLDAWIRSRLRSIQLKKWKKPGKFQRIMIRAGFDPKEAHRVWIKMNRWQSVMRRPVRFVMNLDWFRELKLVFLHDYTIAFSRA
ncbi:group II intron reverse transcriptase/maturase [Sedimenticola hydrogenitrophicus]|uniref:group II intron reverse transcriptase/maturase n=1 Tax=Sedimenticola hydrogenitrophicus TaxID=2967975 RepID=UPI0021A42125|nr:group II intron reverse transcriptase/maturase [Sedimenticola hydrogenitrophicus]